MRTFSVSMSRQHRLYLLLSLLFTIWSSQGYAISPDEAAERVKAQSCRDNQTVEQILNQSIKVHSQRDIGWRTFQEQDYYDVERVILINKSMELHYRWRVDSDGRINFTNDRALKLCIKDS